MIKQLKYTISEVSKILVPLDQTYFPSHTEAPLLDLCTFIDLTLNFQPMSVPDSKVNNVILSG